MPSAIHDGLTSKQRWRLKDIERARSLQRASAKKYREKCAEKARATSRECHAIWYQKNKQKRLHQIKEYRKNLADKALHQMSARRRSSKRRAAKRGAKGNGITNQEWSEILFRYNHRCAYCGDGTEKMTQDHVVPLAKKGAHDASNIAPACLRCNSAKRDRIWTPRIFGDPLTGHPAI